MTTKALIHDPRTESIRDRAIELGFGACGFTTVDPLGCDALLESWLAEGRHGYMAYLERDPRRRTQPGLYLEGAASAVVVAWPYTAPRAAPNWRARLSGRIAAYALGPDYHSVMAAKLEELAEYIKRCCGGESRVHVDAGPLLEKNLARRAGLGWFGHNTNILSRQLGSYFLLGCVVTQAVLRPDPAASEHYCGSCTACIPACPTAALDSGPTIDARRCISYLTIEHRGPIDPELRPLMGNWVFGCDDCQDICPWNADAALPAPELSPPLTQLLLISDDEFQRQYSTTAVSRAKRRGLARNAAIALGNSGNSKAIAPLAEALAGHDEALVRAHAAWALGQLGGREV